MMLPLAFLPEKRFMLRALSLAEEAAAAGEVPVGAVVVKDGQVIGEGRNRREEGRTALAHAEVEAIHRACQALGTWRLTGCDLYVTLEPCPMCAGGIINARISEVHYGTRDERAGACGSVLNLFEERFHHRPRLYRGPLEEECRALLQKFFQNLRGNPENNAKV